MLSALVRLMAPLWSPAVAAGKSRRLHRQLAGPTGRRYGARPLRAPTAQPHTPLWSPAVAAGKRAVRPRAKDAG